MADLVGMATAVVNGEAAAVTKAAHRARLRILDVLAPNPTDWKFSGEVVDHRIYGAARCSCGHPVRFELVINRGNERKPIGADCIDHLAEIHPEMYAQMKAAWGSFLEAAKEAKKEMRRLYWQARLDSAQAKETAILNVLESDGISLQPVKVDHYKRIWSAAKRAEKQVDRLSAKYASHLVGADIESMAQEILVAGEETLAAEATFGEAFGKAMNVPADMPVAIVSVDTGLAYGMADGKDVRLDLKEGRVLETRKVA